ncbi:hypothetical protein IFR05_007258 [Cadophora sp. M221]|nr:hypothetical protein IFR05_007258 [Cadophora sp. M221]
MSSPKFPISLRSGYRKVADAESWDILKSVNQHGSQTRRFFPGYRIAFFAISGLYIVSMSLAFAVMFHPELFQSTTVSPMIPDIPRDQTVVFNGFVDFEVQRTKNDAWAKLMPSGRGFVEIPVEVPLEDGGTEVKNDYFCISMFHQLHCIAGLKAAFDSMSNENDSSQTDHSTHLAHCFDYLRQGVMCAGDMTLEPAFELTGKDSGVKVVNGWNVEHQCRNYQTMYDFAEENRYQNTSGIL